MMGQDAEDFVLLRNDGVPLYNLTSVIDDHLMGITHVLRGEEHITNTHKQIALYRSFDWSEPFFVHLSVILNKEGKKLSKRDVTNEVRYISQLKEMGFLPQAVTNYLLLIGWHPKTTKEFFSLRESVESFEFNGLQISGAVFDFKKLEWFNHHYTQKMPIEEFEEKAVYFLGLSYDLLKHDIRLVKELALFFRPQINYFKQLVSLCNFFFNFECNKEKDFKLTEEEKRFLFIFKEKIESLKEWEVEKIKEVIEKSLFESSLKKKDSFSCVKRDINPREAWCWTLFYCLFFRERKSVKLFKKNIL